MTSAGSTSPPLCASFASPRGRTCVSRCSGSMTTASLPARPQPDEARMPGTKEIAPGRFRQDPGRAYEDFEVGHVYEHRPGRTITEADNIWFTLLTMNQHALHFAAAHAAGT